MEEERGHVAGRRTKAHMFVRPWLRCSAVRCSPAEAAAPRGFSHMWRDACSTDKLSPQDARLQQPAALRTRAQTFPSINDDGSGRPSNAKGALAGHVSAAVSQQSGDWRAASSPPRPAFSLHTVNHCWASTCPRYLHQLARDSRATNARHKSATRPRYPARMHANCTHQRSRHDGLHSHALRDSSSSASSLCPASGEAQLRPPSTPHGG